MNVFYEYCVTYENVIYLPQKFDKSLPDQRGANNDFKRQQNN